MIKSPSDGNNLQKQFQEINTHLMNVMDGLLRSGNPLAAGSIQDIALLSQSISKLERDVKDQLKLRQSELGALMGVGSVINSSLGLNRVLETVMDTLIALIHAERGFLMLRESNGELSVKIARGIAHVNLNADAFRVSKTIIQRVADTCEPVLTNNAQIDPRFGSQLSVATYQLRSIMSAPLMVRKELIGVLYVDNRAYAGMFQESDLELISAFANQAAVAIDNAGLFEKLRESNDDLRNAYQETLEGWVRMLDLRDKETEGHTQRVTILTERLARIMGVHGDALVQITRGALLHDVGKIAIPDSILLKPAGLTDDERELIRQHPIYAYNMINPIEFLRPAIDIPHCHHERWDGTGYPRRLKGEEIPFAARIFAVIDVWDALTSNRPYRKGLPVDEVKQRIQDDSGRHFDPQVVQAFMKMEDLSV